MGAKQKIFITMLTSVISYIHFGDHFLIYIDIDSFNVMVKIWGGGGQLLNTVITGHWVQVLGIGVDSGE